MQYVGEKSWDDLEIRIYPGADGTFTLYEDEGDTYNYERGQFTEIRFTWDDSARRLTIAPRQGSYEGMLTTRQFRLVLVTPDSHGAQTVTYNGQELTIKL